MVLFDEIEKAHPDVLNILLQILDEGRITDAQGRVVSFENTVIVLTSNAGSNIRGSSIGFDKTAGDISRERAMKALSEFLRPEFLARIDEVVVFSPLTRADYKRIAGLNSRRRFPTGVSNSGMTTMLFRPSPTMPPAARPGRGMSARSSAGRSRMT